MENDTKLLISSFVMIIIGLVLWQAQNDVISQTQRLGIANQSSITVTGATFGAANTPINALIFFGNGSNTATLGTEANFSRNGTVTISKSVFTSTGPFDLKYSYEGTNYMTDASARSVTGIIPLFTALALMAVGVVMAVMSFRKNLGI